MAGDLDRAYVINGGDLRDALARNSWAFQARGHIGEDDYVGELALPEDVAGIILEERARPLEDAAPGVTVSQLAGALESFWVEIRESGSTRMIHRGVVHGEIADPDAVAEALHATLSRMAALREEGDGGPPEHPTGPRLRDADLCATCGNQFPEGQICAACQAKRDNVVGDLELAAIARIIAELDAMTGESGAGEWTAVRVLRYVAGRYGFQLAGDPDAPF